MVADRIALGAGEDYFSAFQSFIASATSTNPDPLTRHPKLDVSRVFIPTGNTTSGGMWTNAENRIGQGYAVWLSVKPAATGATRFSQVAAGSEDARWTTIANQCMDWAPTGLSPAGFPMKITPFHEPEDAAFGTGAQYRAAFAHIYTLFKTIAPTWECGPIFSHNTLSTPAGTAAPGTGAAQRYAAIFPNNPNRVANDWFPTGFLDFCGIDFYNYRGSVAGFDTNGWCNPSKPPLHQGKALYATQPEWGNNASDDPASDPDKLQHWITYAQARGCPKVSIGEMAAYFLNPGNAYPPSAYSGTFHYTANPGGAIGEVLDWHAFWGTYWKGATDVVDVVCTYDKAGGSYGQGSMHGISGSLLGPQPAIGRAWATIGDLGEDDPPPPPPPPPPVGSTAGGIGLHRAARTLIQS